MTEVRPLVLGVLVLVAGSATPSAAQSFEVLADFGAPEGMQPFGGLIEASDGYYYGTTGGGGVGFGTIFRVDSNGELQTLFLFSGPDGSRPEGPLVQASNGSLYGTTRMGGAAGKGTIFRFNPAGAGTFTLLRSFGGSDGAEPRSGLVEGADGDLYGTTSTGGLSCATTTCGTIFRLTLSGTFTTVLKFNKTNGANPVGGLAAALDGRLFGTTSRGGTLDRGTVFALSLSGTITTLQSFNFANGFSPYATLVRAADGSFYGSTYGGGTLTKGTLFRVTPAGALTVLHSFTGSEGSYPSAPLVQAADGAFYGTASMGGASDKGTVFKLASGVVTRLRSLSPSDGINPSAALVPTGPSVFYGATASAGPPGSAGTLFTVNTAGAFTIVHAFKGSPVKPYSALVEGSDGRLLGTTYAGGGFGRGTIYSIDLSGQVDLIHAFTGTDGGAPTGGVVESSTGELFVNTTTGGISQVGTVVKVSAAGTASALVSLSVTNGYPANGTLVEASDGNFYGTTYNGGLGYGTIFRVTRAGAFSVVYRFTANDGRNPYAGMIRGPSGLLYGTTTGGGTLGLGVVYSFNPASSDYRRLASFTNATGASPRGALVYAEDGNFYGTTMNSGASAVGTIFRFDPTSDAITNLYSFTGASGAHPYAGLVQGSDSLFYGTTYGGGASNYGTIFKFNATTRQLTTLHSFRGSDGAYPHGALLLASDEAFYGTTTTGGSSGNGLVFKVSSGGGGGRRGRGDFRSESDVAQWRRGPRQGRADLCAVANLRRGSEYRVLRRAVLDGRWHDLQPRFRLHGSECQHTLLQLGGWTGDHERPHPRDCARRRWHAGPRRVRHELHGRVHHRDRSERLCRMDRGIDPTNQVETQHREGRVSQNRALPQRWRELGNARHQRQEQRSKWWGLQLDGGGPGHVAGPDPCDVDERASDHGLDQSELHDCSVAN